MSAYKDKGKRERYVMLRYWMLNSDAWKSLPGLARALYVEIVQRYNGRNNGHIPYSVREAVQALRISKDTVRHLLGILQARGFIVCTRKGYFSVKTTKDASEWRLTEYDSDHPVAHATKDFMRWQLPEDADIDALNRQPSHHRKFRTRYPQPDRTVPPAAPHGTPTGP
jgi:DNA-binding transcriptional MocR family regulator